MDAMAWRVGWTPSVIDTLQFYVWNLNGPPKHMIKRTKKIRFTDDNQKLDLQKSGFRLICALSETLNGSDSKTIVCGIQMVSI